MNPTHESVQFHEGNRPGLVGEIVRWHGLYYVRDQGWPEIFESLCAEQLGEIAKHLATRDDVALFSAWEGSTFLAAAVMDARPGERTGTRLRFFIASDAARGRGVGGGVLARALAWSESRGDSCVWLTTVANLTASAHLYRKFGFRLVAESADYTWGSEHLEQLWEREQRDG
ncbi:MAG: GNAT family N-acetyltransferase [Gammaproteobacteria bacterium]